MADIKATVQRSNRIIPSTVNILPSSNFNGQTLTRTTLNSPTINNGSFSDTPTLPGISLTSNTPALRTEIGLGNVENKSSATIRSEIEDGDIPATITRDTELSAHTSRTDNPHSVTATQVGLGNVTNESKATMFSSPAFTGVPTISTPINTVPPTNVGSILMTATSENLAIGHANVLGTGTQANATAVGSLNNVSSEYGTGVGYNNTVSGAYASAFGFTNTVSGASSTTIGHFIKTTVDKVAELGYWSNATTRGGAIRISGNTGMVAATIQNRDSAYTDGGATKGSEADNTLMREGYSLRRSSTNLFLDLNVGGTITTKDLGTFASSLAPINNTALTGTPTAPTASAATNSTQIATTEYTTTAISNLVGSAPATLNTLNEIAEALNDSPAQIDNILSAVGQRLVIGNNLSDLNNAGTARTNLALGNVTNESKSTMFSNPTFTGTVSGVTATHVGLGNVTNESKTTMFSSPTFTGNATFNSPITIGNGTFDYGVTRTDTVIIGDGFTTTTAATENVLIGHNVQSAGTENIVIGDGARADDASGGPGASASAKTSVIIGKSTYGGYYTQNSVAIGTSAQVRGENNVAIGNGASSSSYDANKVVIGKSATALNSNTIAIGNTAYAYQSNSIAIGNNAHGESADGIAIGRNIVIHRYANSSIVIGESASCNATGADQSVVIGRSASSLGGNGIAIGDNADTGSSNSISIGHDTYSGLGGSGSDIAIGNTARTSNGGSAEYNIAIGKSATSGTYNGPGSITHSMAIGFNANAGNAYVSGGGIGATAIGYRAKTTVPKTTELGFWSDASTRGGAVRINGGTGQVSATIQNRSSAYTDGGATKGSEADNTLMREAYSFRRDSTNLFLDLNVAGSITTKDLGAFASDLAPTANPTFTGNVDLSRIAGANNITIRPDNASSGYDITIQGGTSNNGTGGNVNIQAGGEGGDADGPGSINIGTDDVERITIGTTGGNNYTVNSSSAFRTAISLGNVTNESKATMFTDPTFTGTVSGVTATHVGLGNVTNESKATMFSNPTFTGNVDLSRIAGANNITIQPDNRSASGYNVTIQGGTSNNSIGGNVNIQAGGEGSEGTAPGDINIGTDGIDRITIGTSQANYTINNNSAFRTAIGLGNVTNESKSTMFSNPTFTGTVSGVTATHVGLGNVTNESKATMFSGSTFTGTTAATAITIPNSAGSGSFQGFASLLNLQASDEGRWVYNFGNNTWGSSYVKGWYVSNSGDLNLATYGNTTHDPQMTWGNDGTVTIPNDLLVGDKIVHSGDTNTAIRFPANDTITFETANIERIRIASTGEVGIGKTATTGVELDVSGDIAASGTITSTSSTKRPVQSDESDDSPIRNIRKVTQAQYDALTPDANTLYVIV